MYSSTTLVPFIPARPMVCSNILPNNSRLGRPVSASCSANQEDLTATCSSACFSLTMRRLKPSTFAMILAFSMAMAAYDETASNISTVSRLYAAVWVHWIVNNPVTISSRSIGINTIVCWTDCP